MEAWYLVAVVLGFFACIAVLNAAYYSPAFRAGYRPWKDRPEPDLVPIRVGEPRARITGRMVSGWSPTNPARFEMTADATGALVFGSGPRIWIDRDVVRSVEVVRWWIPTWILFDAADRRFGSLVFRPDDPADAVRALRDLGWPVTDHPAWRPDAAHDAEPPTAAGPRDDAIETGSDRRVRSDAGGTSVRDARRALGAVGRSGVDGFGLFGHGRRRRAGAGYHRPTRDRSGILSGQRLSAEQLEVVDAVIGPFRRHERGPFVAPDLIRYDQVPGDVLVELLDRLGGDVFWALEESPEEAEVRSIVRTCDQPVFDVQVVHRKEDPDRSLPYDDRLEVKALGVRPEDLDVVETLLGPVRVEQHVWTWEELR